MGASRKPDPISIPPLDDRDHRRRSGHNAPTSSPPLSATDVDRYARLAVRAASDALEVLKPGKDSHYTRLQNQCDAFAALCANHLRLLIGISPDAPLE